MLRGNENIFKNEFLFHALNIIIYFSRGFRFVSVKWILGGLDFGAHAAFFCEKTEVSEFFADDSANVIHLLILHIPKKNFLA